MTPARPPLRSFARAVLVAVSLLAVVACDSDTLTELEERGFLGIDAEIVVDESIEIREATLLLDGDEVSNQELTETSDDGRYRLRAVDDDVDPGRYQLEVRIDRTSTAGPKTVQVTVEATYAMLGDSPEEVLDTRRTATLVDGEGIVFDLDL